MAKISFTKSRRVTALVDCVYNYEVDQEYILRLVRENGYTTEEALEDAISNGECEVSNYEDIISEVLEEHETEITVD